MPISFICPKCQKDLITENGETKVLHIYNCKEEPDMVNSPPHYRINEETEVIDVIKYALTEEEYKGYLIGNCIKYALRNSYKNGDEDLRKMHYYSKELESVL